TLSLAFLRFIEAAKGRITLDNVDISKIGLEDLRRNVTIIPQDPVLFNGTIRFNLDPFGEYPDELVWDALKRAHLVRERGSQSTSATTSVYEGSSEGLNDNALERMSGIFTSLDAEIKENGQNLSLGQRQLVALARALVRRSRLIIMDEATASVDFDTDDRIQRTIRGPEFADSTLFCIAHRLRTIIDYDRVLVLDKGKIAEFDTPWNLLQKDDSDSSIFKSMCLKSGEYECLLESAKNKGDTETCLCSPSGRQPKQKLYSTSIFPSTSPLSSPTPNQQEHRMATYKKRRIPGQGEDEDAAKLQLGEDFQDADCLLISEVRILLEAQYDNKKEDKSMTNVYEKTLEYVQKFSRYTNRDTVKEVRALLKTSNLEPFECAQLGNLCCNDYDEAKALIPSISSKIDDEVLDSLLKQMDSLKKYQS
ncbi:P-loop containing nucleoside triphosphate hydrolase protein, partial [Martensiomyces pterosporus]